MEQLRDLKNMMVNMRPAMDRLAGHKRLTNDDRAAILAFYTEVAVVISELWKEIPE